MADLVDQKATAAPLSTNFIMTTKKKELLSDAMKRTSEWIFSQEIPKDLTVHAGGTSFLLHKFPLVSKCGFIKRLMSGSSGVSLSVIKIPDIPGGAEAFELVSKFCYGINFDIGLHNIGILRCVSEYLEMTEDYATGNLVGRTETYLDEVALKSLGGAVSVLHSTESLLPIAEKMKLVNRCIDAVVLIASKENQFGSSAKELFGKARKRMEPKEEYEKRVVVETIVGLLPWEKNAMSVSFLSMLLRASIYLDTTVACRINLERRIGLQLDQAVLDDLLIPSFFPTTGDTLFDVDTVQRIMMNFLDREEGTCVAYNADEVRLSPPQPEMERVEKLMEDFLAEIASDSNLTVPKFVNFAECMPEHSRTTEDPKYRAIDIYLKAHPYISDTERKKVCSVMDCQKLSREACAHAAQSDRLPVQTVVQVLYYEQQRLREAMDSSLSSGDSPTPASKVTVISKDAHPVTDNELSKLEQENQDLKLELAKMKIQLEEIKRKTVKSSPNTPLVITYPSADKPPLAPKSIINSMSKKLGRLNLFVRADGTTPSRVQNRPSKDRRHSMS
ncbi:BTB/POZ domain-containing protein SR1IP1 isoform X2 [Daucus carota subsp. sativus]|uniref:BTB/POZ domain-containing protein SR1IP1 isoform X2 n=1 Tax=Daucus carota subsp. sativus TaxID=79200 RepID=UPI0007EFE2FB|nr:PREDICTED: BTB/POZ domain-containing protein At5g67385-like isoform X2 [Daucus carota subsp. sativus]